MQSIPLKTCARCAHPKPLSEFAKGPRYRDGQQSYCRACMRAYRMERKQDPEQYQRDRDRANRYYRERYKNRVTPKRRERDKRRWHTDPVYRARKGAWKSLHWRTDPNFREKRHNWDSRRYHRLKNSPAFRAKSRAWGRLHAHLRRARIRNSPGHFTQAEWQQLCKQYQHRCLACGEQKPLTIDHVIPLSCGGHNTIDNIQPLCMDCNRRKSNQTIDYRTAMQPVSNS